MLQLGFGGFGRAHKAGALFVRVLRSGKGHMQVGLSADLGDLFWRWK